MRNWFLPKSSHLGAYSLPYRLFKKGMLWSWAIRRTSVRFRAGDILLLPDAYWGRRRIWGAVATARASGVKTVTVFYDMIPLTHVEFVGRKRSAKFRVYLSEVLRHSDLVLAISKTVRNQLRDFLSTCFEFRGLAEDKIQSFRLGADFSEASGSVRDEVIEYFREGGEDGAARPYLVVGSLDPRKNHEQVIDAFELLAERGMRRRVCFVGRSGGLSEKLLERMKESPLVGTFLTHWSDLNDVELQHAYRNCEAVIMPSVIEGFGLPIVEALWHSAKVFASDIEIHREVGGNHCGYFPLHDGNALAELIVLEEQRPRPSAGQKVLPTTWQASAREVLAKSLPLCAAERAA